jgi:myo-inositol-1(or 4)-monophosphatase
LKPLALKNLASISKHVLALFDELQKDIEQKTLSTLRILDKGAEGKATSLDIFLEKKIKKKLAPLLPADFIGEECSSTIPIDPGKSWQWLIDPIDGTNNLINSIPYFCVSVALLHLGELKGGWILDPNSKTRYVGLAQMGAWKISGNQKVRLKLKANRPFSNGIFATTHFRGLTAKESEGMKKAFAEMGKVVRSTRKFGSAALDLCFCSELKLDGFWQKHMRSWDVAAGAIICQEAGLAVLDRKGKIFKASSESIVVAHPLLVPDLLRYLKRYDKP